jgi:glucose/arabinose dehydrogenase
MRGHHQFRPTADHRLEARSLLSHLTGIPRVPGTRAGTAEVHTVHTRSRERPIGQLQPVSGYPNLQIQRGFKLHLLSTGLSFPTAMTFSPRGKMWVSEAGGIAGTAPQIVQIHRNGTASTVLSANQLPSGMLVGPINDVTYHGGWLWITAEQVGVNGWDVGAITKFKPSAPDPASTFTTVITNLPSNGDHATDQIVFDRRGKAYFSQGTATNSGVVGTDNSWLTTSGGLSTFHDFAPVPIVLGGSSYTNTATATIPSETTSPYEPFGVTAPAGTLIPAATPATPQQGIIAGGGTVYSFNPRAKDPTSTLHLLAWGFRNPYGISFDPSHPNTLYVANNGTDQRGSRPINNEDDDLFAINLRQAKRQPEFFGWPDFFDNPQTNQVLPVTDPMFSVNGTTVQPVFDPSFSSTLTVQHDVTELGNHTAAGKFDISTKSSFGSALSGDLLMARTGSLPPSTGATSLVGYDVISVNPRSGQVNEFLTHTSNSPSAIFDSSSFDKPLDVQFRGGRMFIVDFGVLNPGNAGGPTDPNSGKIWVVTRGG